jgi:hypothetical protein
VQRRKFLTLLGATSAFWPISDQAARADEVIE